MLDPHLLRINEPRLLAESEEHAQVGPISPHGVLCPLPHDAKLA